MCSYFFIFFHFLSLFNFHLSIFLIFLYVFLLFFYYYFFQFFFKFFKLSCIFIYVGKCVALDFRRQQPQRMPPGYSPKLDENGRQLCNREVIIFIKYVYVYVYRYYLSKYHSIIHKFISHMSSYGSPSLFSLFCLFPCLFCLFFFFSVFFSFPFLPLSPLYFPSISSHFFSHIFLSFFSRFPLIREDLFVTTPIIIL